MTELRDLPAALFEGVIPVVLGTLSSDGLPNATWLSHVYRVDDRHVGLSCQFFKKTRANLAIDPNAELLVVDPVSGLQWTLSVRFVRSETMGRVFEEMKRTIEAIASLTGMTEVFALQSADIFEVTAIEPMRLDNELAPQSTAPELDVIGGLARLGERISGCRDLESIVESSLTVLVTHLGFETVNLYLHEASESMLYALASHGAGTSGVGARLPVGMGVVGTCAKHRMPIRITESTREIRYSQAIHDQVMRAKDTKEIAIPSLARARSFLAVPIVLDGELFGVIESESIQPLAFLERHAQILTTAGQLLGQAMARHHGEEDDEPASTRASTTGDVLRVKWYEADDSILVDDEYLIKGLPGRILYLLLSIREEEGRASFTNRELRLHPSLKLPSYKDNLETRLLMLKRRLDDKQSALRLVREERGRLEIRCDRRIALERVPAS